MGGVSHHDSGFANVSRTTTRFLSFEPGWGEVTNPNSGVGLTLGFLRHTNLPPDIP